MNKTMTGALLDGAHEFEADTVDEAVASGLKEMGLHRDDVEIDVVEKGARGFLGIGARPARVRVTSKRMLAPGVRRLTEELLALMGVKAEVAATQDGSTVDVHVRSEESDGLLIGRKGETLASLQHVLTRMAARQFDGPSLAIRLDVAGYRLRREEHLRELAKTLAQRVERTGRRAMTEPLPPSERRTVHRALAEFPAVDTHAAGSGVNKRVVLVPARKGKTAAAS